MGNLFGTDGIRGTANADLTADLALDVGRAVGHACRDGVLGRRATGRPRVLVGRDTRPSGPMLEGAVVAGLCSSGADVLRAGIVPTPAVAFLVSAHDADAGIVLSASHNPAPDNGIKVFGAGGWKLTDAAQEALEALVGRAGAGADVGRVEDVEDAVAAYVDHLVEGVGSRLDGMRVVVDCAHGAACGIAPAALERLGAEVIRLHDSPDGDRINDGCGATHPEVVAEAARAQAAIGLTHDGDADRVLAADEEGRIVDGDAIIAILARHLRDQGRLRGNAVAVTVMTNQAFRTWCASEGIEIVETPVGDRNVLDAMRSRDLAVGGEQSGHVILIDEATTGDGILTGLHLLDAVASSGRRLADIVPFRPLPQVLVNVRAASIEGFEEAHAVDRVITDVRAGLGSSGRILVRRSGTEPLVRVMVEAPTETEARRAAETIADAVRRELAPEEAM